MGYNTDTTNELLGTRRASNQYGAPYYILTDTTTVIGFTGSALPTGAFILPTGNTAFVIYNNTSAPIIINRGTLAAAAPNVGISVVPAQTEKLFAFENAAPADTISYALLASAPTLGTFAAAGSYSGGAFFVTPVRP